MTATTTETKEETNTVPISSWVTPTTFAGFKEVAKAQGRSLSSHLRFILEQSIAQHKAKPVYEVLEAAK